MNVPLHHTSSTSFGFFLNFSDPGHCDHTTGDTEKFTLNDPFGDTRGTFFGEFHGEPIDYLTRSLRSHDLGHCECPRGFF